MSLSSFLSDNDNKHQLTKLKIIFDKFIHTFEKIYDSVEEREARFLIFADNVLTHLPQLLTAETLNFSPYLDMTQEEFKNKFLSKVKIGNRSDIKVYESTTLGDDPEDFDWRSKNVVTPVKNQGQCGSCWAFSAVGNIESQHAIKRGGDLAQYSEQQLVDCDRGGESAGCDGGDMVDAFRYLIRVGGIEKQSVYPYTAKNGTCKFATLLVSESLSDLVQIEKDEEKIKKALLEIGPLSVALDASSLQFYSKGSILRQTNKCGQTEDDLNHGVVIVGYGVENGVKYWIVKNSWGVAFGDDGYFRIERGVNACGISLDVSSSILK
jgi:C1A family cysteine protease